MEPAPQDVRRSVSLLDTVTFKREVIDRWKNKFEIWPFAYGDDILTIFSALSATYTTFYFRSQLKLLHYARMTSYVPVVGLTAILTQTFHVNYINYKIINPGTCSICTEVKASIGQAVTSCLYPLLLSPIACFYFADRLLTYPVPPLFSAPKEIFQLFQKLARPHRGMFLTICGMQMIIATGVTHEKIKTFTTLGILTQPKRIS